MNLIGITTTYNNEKIVPYVMKYAMELEYDKLIVFDNESTDRTIELLKQYPFVEIRTYHSDVYDEDKRIQLIQNAVIELTPTDELTWVTVGDFDEVFYYAQQDKDRLKDYLVKLSSNGYNVCTEHMVNLISENSYHDINCFLHTQVEKCAYCNPFDWNKPILFRVDNLKGIFHTIGHHYGYFEFYGEDTKQFYNTKHLHVFHLKYAFGKEHLLSTTKDYNERGMKFNGNTRDYYYEIDKIEHDFESTYRNGINVNTYLEHKMLNGDDSYEHNDLLVSFPIY